MTQRPRHFFTKWRGLLRESLLLLSLSTQSFGLGHLKPMSGPSPKLLRLCQAAWRLLGPPWHLESRVRSLQPQNPMKAPPQAGTSQVERAWGTHLHSAASQQVLLVASGLKRALARPFLKSFPLVAEFCVQFNVSCLKLQPHVCSFPSGLSMLLPVPLALRCAMPGSCKTPV